MAAEALLASAAAASTAGVGLLRFAWSLPRRSLVLNSLGWAAVFLGCVLAGAHSGAWGISIATMLGMAAALVLLAHAAVASPSSAGPKVSNRRVRMLPEGNEPLHLRRRIITFLIIAMAAPVVSTIIAVGSRVLAMRVGTGEANANVIALAVMPLAWTALSHVLLMQEERSTQVKMLMIWAAIGSLGVILELVG
ncbi:hypothetical protein LQ954_00060 [Sphingomonas sp. IC-11]|uniref:hypothetical protein n=1 Tax=Sphingomonas sp. IC-11 TaxID=2898528 RepID=UPI001E4A6E4D|nr:hypothetical protein [Sphingomonas sp. IC-11]MCD2314534.1 hypothetical protein [Sphingomonas sp. IC-11]